MGVNKVVYDGETLVDMTDATVTEDTLLEGATAYNAAGDKLEGKVVTTTVAFEQEATSGGKIGTLTIGDETYDLYAPTQTTISGNAGSATKLANARAIDGVSFNGSAAITHFGTCSTAAATAAKVVALTGFTLVTGAKVAVKFTVTNTAANPTLNVNGTGAKAIMYRGSAITAGYLAANRVYEFVYDGTDWELVGDINTDTNTDTKVTQGRSKTSSYRPLLMHSDCDAAGTDPGTVTGQTYYNESIMASPGTGDIAATSFTGALNGNADTASNIQSVTGTTAATAGWYRIAKTAASIINNVGVFVLKASGSGVYSTVILSAGTDYGRAASTLVNVLHAGHWSTAGISKARIVYNATYSGNYAYLEVYVPTAKARTIYVKAIYDGWELVAPSTVGEIPDGYTSKEVDLTNTTPIDRGGTGGTTANAAQYNILSGIPDESDSAVVDGNLIAYRYASPTSSKGSLYYRTVSTLWTYIKDKIESLMSDYVVERGTSGIWTYTKWASGYCEAHGKTTKALTLTTVSGAGYYNTLAVTPPSVFTQIDTVNPAIYSNKGLMSVSQYAGGLTGLSFFIFCTMQFTTQQSITLGIELTGRWD